MQHFFILRIYYPEALNHEKAANSDFLSPYCRKDHSQEFPTEPGRTIRDEEYRYVQHSLGKQKYKITKKAPLQVCNIKQTQQPVCDKVKDSCDLGLPCPCGGGAGCLFSIDTKNPERKRHL